MKKIDSIHYGGKILLAALLLSAAGTVFLHLSAPVPGMILLGAGAVVGAFLWVLLQIELRQDRRIRSAILARKNGKTLLSPGVYECRACGCRTVRDWDDICPACGARFIEPDGNGRERGKRFWTRSQ